MFPHQNFAFVAFTLGLQVTACAGGSSSNPSALSPVSRPPVSANPASNATPAPCVAPDCRLFDTPAEAFAEILKTAPRILAVGEFHSLKQHKGLQSPVRRFSTDLLPLLAPQASDIIVELWIPPEHCTAPTKQVEQEQKPVTQAHPEETHNEYLEMGTHAKGLGIQPHPLRPTCDDFQRVLGAGERVKEMLVLTARMLSSTTKRAYQRNEATGAEKMIVTYSGAMHNDLRPDHSCGEPCSIGKELDTLTGGHFVEVDLVVPEYIHEGPVWKERVWYSRFDRHAPHPKTTLFMLSPGSFVLVFPSTPGWTRPQGQEPEKR